MPDDGSHDPEGATAPRLPQVFFDSAYQAAPPWDIGGPQPTFMRLQEAGGIAGTVLDVGCGTGDLALYLAAAGHTVWGVDFAPRAIAEARRKATQQGRLIEFRVQDALDLSPLGRQFDTVVDCGLLHVFGDAERPRYAASLRQVLRPGGVYYLLALSIALGTPGTPQAITADVVRATFGPPWRIRELRPDVFVTQTAPDGRPAIFASIERP